MFDGLDLLFWADPNSLISHSYIGEVPFLGLVESMFY